MLKSIFILLTISFSLCSINFLESDVDDNEISKCMNHSFSKYPFLNDKYQNCGKAAYGYCCAFGTSCDCSKGVSVEGQCGKEAYMYCCGFGKACKCDLPPKENDDINKKSKVDLLSDIELLKYTTNTVYEECNNPEHIKTQNQVNVTINKVENCVSKKQKALKILKNCKTESYAFCCAVGTSCNCSEGASSPGQCQASAYVFCCLVGEKCDCTQPPIRTKKTYPEIENQAKNLINECITLENSN